MGYIYLFANKNLEIHEKFRQKVWTEETFWKIYDSYTDNNYVYPKETFCTFIAIRLKWKNKRIFDIVLHLKIQIEYFFPVG